MSDWSSDVCSSELAALREAAEMRPLDAEMVEQPDRIGGQRLDRIGAGRRVGAAVAAAVVADDAEVPLERLPLRVPHVQVGAQRVGQQKRRTVGTAGPPMVQLEAVGRRVWNGILRD